MAVRVKGPVQLLRTICMKLQRLKSGDGVGSAGSSAVWATGVAKMDGVRAMRAKSGVKMKELGACIV